MSGINEYFLNSYTPPKLMTFNQNFVGFGDIHKHLKSYQTIIISKEEMDSLAKNKDFWFYESDMEMYDKLESMTKMFDDNKFDNIKDGYGISEYIGVNEKYIPSIEYLQYIVMTNSDVVISVYDAYSLYNISKRNEILRDKIVGQLLIRHNDDYDQTLPKYEFIIPKNIKYSKFNNKKYESNVLVSCFQDPVHILSVDIPYSFYSYQPLPHNIYTFDIDKKIHRFGSLYENEFNKLLDDICINGITKPLFMRMNGEVLSSTDEETNLTLLIAKLLKLPSIPVNIYLSNEDIGKNHLIDAVMYDSNNKSIYKNIGFMKNVFEPYMIVHKPNDQIINDNIQKYTVFSDDDNLIIRYLNSNEDIDFQNYSNSDIKYLHNKMANKEVEKINKEIDKVIKYLNGQE